jgi:hypothetical protein
MNSSNRLLREFAGSLGTGDPGFALVLAFDYYDGPEDGLALYPSGEGVRFASLGDSKSRMFRAFELIPIPGNWWIDVQAMQGVTGVAAPRRVLVPSDSSQTLVQLKQRVFNAAGVSQYIGVGTPDLQQLAVAAIDQQQLDALRRLGCSPAGFRLAHRFIKEK